MPRRGRPCRSSAFFGTSWVLAQPAGWPAAPVGGSQGPVKPVNSVTPSADGPSCRRTVPSGFKHTAVDQPNAGNAESRTALGVSVLSALVIPTCALRSIWPKHTRRRGGEAAKEGVYPAIRL